MKSHWTLMLFFLNEFSYFRKNSLSFSHTNLFLCKLLKIRAYAVNWSKQTPQTSSSSVRLPARVSPSLSERTVLQSIKFPVFPKSDSVCFNHCLKLFSDHLGFFLTIFYVALSKQFLTFSPFLLNFVPEHKVLTIRSSNTKLT